MHVLSRQGFVNETLDEFYDSFSDLVEEVGDKNSKFYEFIGFEYEYINVNDNELGLWKDPSVIYMNKNIPTGELPSKIRAVYRHKSNLTLVYLKQINLYFEMLKHKKMSLKDLIT